MLLGFKPTFEVPILTGRKIHTIREDKHRRWRAGVNITFATGVRTKNYNCFKKGKCTGFQNIKMRWQGTRFIMAIDYVIMVDFNTAAAWCQYNNNGFEFLKRFAANDGFSTVEDFFKWFDKDFAGVLIHWTNFKY